MNVYNGLWRYNSGNIVKQSDFKDFYIIATPCLGRSSFIFKTAFKKLKPYISNIPLGNVNSVIIIEKKNVPIFAQQLSINKNLLCDRMWFFYLSI